MENNTKYLKHNLTIICLSILLLILVGYNIKQANQKNNLEKEIRKMTDLVDDLKEKVNDLEDEVNDLEDEVSNSEDEVSNLEDEVNDLEYR